MKKILASLAVGAVMVFAPYSASAGWIELGDPSVLELDNGAVYYGTPEACGTWGSSYTEQAEITNEDVFYSRVTHRCGDLVRICVSRTERGREVCSTWSARRTAPRHMAREFNY